MLTKKKKTSRLVRYLKIRHRVQHSSFLKKSVKKNLVFSATVDSSTVKRLNTLKKYLNTLMSQLLVYSKSSVVAFSQIQKLFKIIKKSKSKAVNAYLFKFLDKAVLKFSLRDYKAGAKKLLIAVPANPEKNRLNFFKRLLKDLRTKEGFFENKFVSEIEDFNTKKGVIYTYNQEAYIISKQNRRSAKYAYKAKAYTNKLSNVIKKKSYNFI